MEAMDIIASLGAIGNVVVHVPFTWQNHIALTIIMENGASGWMCSSHYFTFSRFCGEVKPKPFSIIVKLFLSYVACFGLDWGNL